MATGHGSKRETHEDRAVAALLTESSIGAAAKVAGVSESTLLRWLQELDFKARYRAARRDAVEHAVSQLQRATVEAVEALRRNLTSGVPSTEISAAKTILDNAIRGVELTDLAARIEELERANTEQGRQSR